MTDPQALSNLVGGSTDFSTRGSTVASLNKMMSVREGRDMHT